MLISHRRRQRRLVPLLVVIAMILAMNAPGLTAFANEVAPAEVESSAVAPQEEGASVPEEAAKKPSVPDKVLKDAEAPLEAPAEEDEVIGSVEVAPVTAEPLQLEVAAAPVVEPQDVEAQVVYPYADVGAVQLEGWDRTPHERWTSGNVSGYVEGEWIPFRLKIDNGGGSAVTVRVPSMTYKVDHILGGAVAVDATKGWRWETSGGASGIYTPTTQDDASDPMYLRTRLPEASGFVLAKGETGYIYFEGHLAITPFWQMMLPPLLGASGYAGASAQARLVAWNDANIGDRTVPFPVGLQTLPNGGICGLKFADLDGDGRMDTGEGPLGGWEFHLEYKESPFGFVLTATSASNGTFSFANLPPGTYELTEVAKDGWVSTNLPKTIEVAGVRVGPVYVGNQPRVVTKTWALELSDAVPMADSYFVRYVMGDGSHDLALQMHDGVYKAHMDVMWGATITSWQFFAMMGSEEIPLSGVMGPAERMVESRTNSHLFTPGVIGGYKWISTAAAQIPGVGWTIELYRDGVLYDTAVTGDDGMYEFSGLLPGSYTLKEVAQDEYMKIIPVGDWLGPFVVVNGSVFMEGTSFTNAPRPTGITVTKTAEPGMVHVGDMITYTIDVTNSGHVAVSLMSVTDPMFEGGANLLAAPVVLAAGESLSDKGLEIIKMMAAPDADMVSNTATASGMTLFGPVSDDDDATVEILRPDIEVTKVVVPDSVLDSGLVTYYVTVTNTGNTELTIDVTDYIDAIVHKVLDPALVLGPGEHMDYEWTETVTMPVEDTVVATGVDELGGEKGTVMAEASAMVAVDVTKTFTLTLFEAMPMADSFFVRYMVGDDTVDLSLLPGADEYTASVVMPYGTVISTWQFFAMMGEEEIPLTDVMGPETLRGPMVNEYDFVPGRISGMKYDDLDASGMMTEGEDGMSGWTIELYRDGVLYDTAITGDDGEYEFTGLLPGTYTLMEVQQPGWEMTESPDEILVGEETDVADAYFGNHHIDITKTFSLIYPDAPAGVEFFVLYEIAEGGQFEVGLDGDGPFMGSDEIPWGSTIATVWWMASFDGHDIVLGIEEPDEMLTEDLLNEFTYGASVSGFKFDDIDGNGIWDEPDETGLEGWTIGLYRLGLPNDLLAALPAPALGYELYAQTITAADGSYSFMGLLPGTYYLAEDQQDGWVMTVSPGGTFVITNGVALTDLNFGNQEPPLPFTDTELEKTADKTTASAGDLVTYTLTYRNIGDGIIDQGVTITDDYDERYMVPQDIAGAVDDGDTLVWVDNVPLGPGDERTITYTMRIDSDLPDSVDKIVNVAIIDPGFHEASWTVTISEPFLPFTGATIALLALLAAGALLIGVALRVKAHSV
ncbi:MAG: DUF11 domain-containing protein [Coriobacteriia bacterium]|nr:DUF11 domain-containing protein [Coriobacteriia bacterium]MBN2822914.1 DUF11 domain-containing protein [Coriobacteriia bacterium]